MFETKGQKAPAVMLKCIEAVESRGKDNRYYYITLSKQYCSSYYGCNKEVAC